MNETPKFQHNERVRTRSHEQMYGSIRSSSIDTDHGGYAYEVKMDDYAFWLTFHEDELELAPAVAKPMTADVTGIRERWQLHPDLRYSMTATYSTETGEVDEYVVSAVAKSENALHYREVARSRAKEHMERFRDAPADIRALLAEVDLLRQQLAAAAGALEGIEEALTLEKSWFGNSGTINWVLVRIKQWKQAATPPASAAQAADGGTC